MGSRTRLLAIRALCAVVGLAVALLLSREARAATSYEVKAAVNDETFIINGEVFKAKTWCFNVEEGDRVIFIEGSASGACSSAVFFDLRSEEKCEVWCE